MSAIKSQYTQEFSVAPVVLPFRDLLACVVTTSMFEFTRAELPRVGQTFESADLNVRFKTEEWNAHVYSHMVELGQGTIGLYFNPPASSAGLSKTTPFKDPYFIEDPDFAWPMILTDCGAYTQIDGSLMFRYAYVPAQSIPTKVEISEYLSPEPWAADELDGTTPMPTPIVVNLRGQSLQIPPCLHPEVEVVRLDPEDELIDFIVGNSEVTENLPQVFPATNMTTWQTHIWKNEVVETPSGMWHLKKFKAIAPIIPRRSVN